MKEAFKGPCKWALRVSFYGGKSSKCRFLFPLLTPLHADIAQNPRVFGQRSKEDITLYDTICMCNVADPVEVHGLRRQEVGGGALSGQS